ncbi:MAG: TasA family protein [Coriobacteriia bacterium]|nr:TasA family protein [Coriobacteriia bacterium]
MRRFIWFAVGAMLALSLTVASAYFTGQAQVPDSVIKAGAVAVSAEPTSAALSIDSLAPGGVQVRTLVVRNTGSLAANLVVTGAKKAGITDFYNALTCTVMRGETVLYQGPLSSLRTAPIALAPAEQGILRVAVGLPASAGNDLAEDYVRLTLYVDAEQVH